MPIGRSGERKQKRGAALCCKIGTEANHYQHSDITVKLLQRETKLLVILETSLVLVEMR